jgi:hypothetical protein
VESATLQIHPVEIDPVQLVNWVIAEHQAQPPDWEAHRGDAGDSNAERASLGDREREELTEIATVGILEIAPLEARKV